MVQVKLNYQPHVKQIPIHASKAQIRVICAGRRGGKSLCCAAEIIKIASYYAQKGEHEAKIAWISPTYDMADVGIEALRTIDKHGSICEEKLSRPKAVTLFGCIKVRFYSCDRPNSLRGKAFDFLVLDEGDFVSDYAWQEVLFPTLALAPTLLNGNRVGGRAIIVSTPYRLNSYFKSLYDLGLTGDHKKYESFRFTSYDNPFIPPEEIDEARNTMPKYVFEREYEAKWPESGQVFDLSKVLTERGKEHKKTPCEHEWVIGLDLAKKHDYTVIIQICSLCGRVYEINRFNGYSWPEQIAKINNFYKISGDAPIFFDATGIGDPIEAMLLEAEITNIHPVHFTPITKKELIHGLQMAFDKGEVKISKNTQKYQQLILELQSYELQSTKTSYTFNAPNGKYDDCVIALALAQYGRNKKGDPHTIDINMEETVNLDNYMWDQVN